MTRLYSFLLLILILLSCSKESTSPEKKTPVDEWPFDPPSSEALDAFEMNAKIGRGFNMGNALESAVEGEGGMYIHDAYLQIIADAGFNSIRLPVSWSYRSMSAPPFTIDYAFFDRVDHVVQTALQQGLTVVLNIHHFDELNERPTAYKEWFLSMWKQIATHYKDYPDELYFEILNEPHGDFDAATWNQFAREALAIIRQENPYRMVVIGPVSWNAIDKIPTLDLPEEDRGIIVTYHYYWPFDFTHQGASWVDGADAWLGTPRRGSPDEKEEVTYYFDQAVDWAEKHDRPLFLGEFGAYSRADDNSRYRWTDYIARSAEKRNISWTYWEFGAGFGAYDRDKNEWRPLLLKALMPD